jgi:hypothetical protein
MKKTILSAIVLAVPLLVELTVVPATMLGEPPGRIASKPLFRDPVHDGAADPVLVWNRAQKKWFMFYTNRRSNVPDLPRATYVHGTRIGVAESDEGGATWKYAGTVAIEYGESDYTHWAPEIIDDGKTYHMYLSIVPGIFADWNAPRDIIHLTSLDLKTWTFQSKLELGSDRVIDANVIRLPDGKWRMWYKNERAKDGSLYYADSPDLFKWTSKGNAIPDVSGEGAKIFRWKEQYWMIVDVWDGLAAFSSSDCSRWKRQPDNLLKQPGTKPTDRASGHHADVVVSTGRAFLFYFVHQSGPDAEGKDKEWSRRSVLQVAELHGSDGTLTCDRNSETRMKLEPK